MNTINFTVQFKKKTINTFTQLQITNSINVYAMYVHRTRISIF